MIDDKPKLYYLMINEEKVESSLPGKYAGHKKLKIFGRLNCWSGKNMFRENRLFFATYDDAINQGFRPCKNCKPVKETDIQ